MPRPNRRAGALLALAALLALGGGACGLKTPPRPLSQVLPPTDGVRAWQRERAVLVTWVLPDPGQQERFGGLEGFELAVSARPALCLDCPDDEPEVLSLESDHPDLQRREGRLYYALAFAPAFDRLRVQVRTQFGIGVTPPSAASVVERAGAIPQPELSWRRPGGSAAALVPGGAGSEPAAGGTTQAGTTQAGTTRSVQFYWEAPRERVVQVIDSAGRPNERVQAFRANLYRRIPPEEWPITPLNGKPLEALQWVVPPLQAEFPQGATGEAYVLRYVDQFGNEGPPSPEVLIPLPGAAR